MFDISFGKLLLVLVIGLIVLGPARLPEAIKTVAGWIKALRRISATVQLELNKELKLQELQDSLKQAEKSGLKNITPEIQSSIDDLKRVAESIQKEFYDTSNEIQPTVSQVTNNKHSTSTMNKAQADHPSPSADEVGKENNVER